MEYHDVFNPDLSERAKQARREYKRNWNKKNPDKVRATQARYWEKKAAEAMENNNEQKTNQIQN